MQLVEEGQAAKLFDVIGERFGIPKGMVQELIGRYREIEPVAFPLFPDVRPTLDSLERLGLKIGLLADNPAPSQRQKLRATSIEDRFDAVVLAREHGAEKPALAGFDEMAARLGVPKDRLVMVGDNPYRDVWGALQAGWQAGYLVRRPGAFFNFDTDLFRTVAGDTASFRVLSSLTDLLWYVRPDGRFPRLPQQDWRDGPGD
jgi:FMN phosphatase YigB (HAD superfamily)